MTHRLATNYAKNDCNRTPIVKVIVENVVTCFFGTQCSSETDKNVFSLQRYLGSPSISVENREFYSYSPQFEL